MKRSNISLNLLDFFGVKVYNSSKSFAHWRISPLLQQPLLHEDAISCLCDIIDFALTTGLDTSNIRILICGDINDLRLYVKSWNYETSFSPPVAFSL